MSCVLSFYTKTSKRISRLLADWSVKNISLHEKLFRSQTNQASKLIKIHKPKFYFAGLKKISNFSNLGASLFVILLSLFFFYYFKHYLSL
jgi:hypothetical protein